MAEFLKHVMEQVFEFVQDNGAWYYHNPGHTGLSSGRDPLIAVYKEGLHTLLDAVGEEAAKVWIHASDQYCPGSDELELTQADKEGQGGYYLLKSLQGKPYVLLLRFFQVHQLFGYLPSRMYIQIKTVPRMAGD